MGTATLKKEFEEIRKRIQAEQIPFKKVTPAQKKKRKENASKSFKNFSMEYLPHHCSSKFSSMHEDFFKKYQAMIDKSESTNEGLKDASAAPRGNAKSTITTLCLPLYCIVFGKRKYIALMSDTTEQAEEFLEMIKAELETNERLKEDFPKLCGDGPKWQVGHVVTRNGIKIKCWGSKKRVRGARHGSRRPDLVICDDLENDENIESPDQRKKLDTWFFKAVMKAGGKYTVYIVVGTILHYDSLLSKLLKRAGWSHAKYKAVIEWSTSSHWQKWETIFSNPANDTAEEESDAYFKKHKKEMLEGTKVLWPEQEDYLYLMKMRVSDGPAYFDSEKQNEPINPDDCTFNESWFAYWTDDYDFVISRYRELFCAVDPSMGKKGNKGDPSAIIVGGVLESGMIDILDADIQRRHPDSIMEAIFDYHQQYNFSSIAIEEVQFQELFKDNVFKEGNKRGIYPPIEGVRPVTDKILRINKLQPHIKNGVIRFRRNQTTLLEQLKYFPKASHDDGPDALEMVFTLIQGGISMPRIRSLAS
jgi:predicted phage terminase large subunit-like protein